MIQLFVALAILFTVASAVPAREYGLRLQPELDSVDVDSYLKNDRLFKLQLKCLLDEGPCDIVGRWLKPRVARALLGECPYCTEIQKVKIDRVLEELQTNRPAVYRSLFVKFIENAGIKVDEDKKTAHKPETKPEEHAPEDVHESLKADNIPTEATKTTDTS